MKFKNYILSILFFALLAASVFLSARIYFSFDFEDFFPKGDSELDFYYSFREKFEHDDNFLLIGFENKSGIFNQTFLTKIDSITKNVSQLSHVEKTLSISNFRYFIKSPFGYIDYPAVHIEDSSRYAEDMQKISQDERIYEKLINKDFTITTIYLKIEDSISQIESNFLIEEIKSIVQKNSIENFHLLGKAYFQTELIRLQFNEFILYSSLSILLVILVTFFIFRRWQCVFICLINVLVTLVFFLGFAGAVHLPFNALSTLYPIVIIIVGISDVIHLLTGYIFELKKGLNAHLAIKKVRKEIGFTTFLTALTTAIGFLTLITSQIQPIREFSFMSAAGVFIAYLVTFYFTSYLLPLFNNSAFVQVKSNENTYWNSALSFFYQVGKSKTKPILLVFICILFLSISGVLKISTNTHIGYGLPKGSEVQLDYAFFDTQMNGFKPFEIVAIAQDTFYVSDLIILNQIELVEQFAKTFDVVNGIQSTTLIYKSLHRANHGDKASEYKLPESEIELSQYENDLKKIDKAFALVLISEDKKYGRITANLSDIGSDSIQKMLQQIEQFIQTQTDTSQVKFIQTGTGIVFDRNTIYLRQNLINGLCFGFIPISLILALFYRNWKVFFISSIPNLFPLILCGGVIGFMQIELDAATSIIFGIIYGIAVDDTIHFLSRYKQELLKGTPKEEAIYITFNETGKAVFTTTLILMFGFSILMLSNTSATFNIGLLTSFTLFAAAISDVFLLPYMIRKFL